MKEHAHTLAQIFVDFWWVVVVPTSIWLLQLIARWALGRVIKSYEDQILNLEKRMLAFEQKDLLPRSEAMEVVHAVQKEHEKIAKETREDFMHLSNLIVDTNDRIDKIYEVLTRGK